MANEMVEKRNALLGKTVVSNLEKRHFEAYYCTTAQEALQKAIELIPEGSSIGWGGSMTIRDMGLTKAVHEKNYTVYDRDLAKSPEETTEILKKYNLPQIENEKLINEEELEKLEEAIAFRNVSNMPSRVKCALLAWHTLEDMFEREKF